MLCPLNKKDVGKCCSCEDCWYWHNRARKNCAIVDTNNDHIIEVDISRIYEEKESLVRKKIERGRDKIKSWLKCLNLLEQIENSGCTKCGHPNCKNKVACNERWKMEERLKQKLPLAKILPMYPSRLYAALRIVEDDINLQKLISGENK